MLVLALGVLLSAALTGLTVWDMRRTQNLFAWDEAYLAALACESWARHRFADTLEQNGKAPIPPWQGKSGTACGGVRATDLQGRLNLNNIVFNGQPVPFEYARLERLVSILGLRPEIASAIMDWVDSDRVPTWPGNAEDNAYRSRRPAHLPANRPFTAIGELRDVVGLDDRSMARLAPHVIALPGQEPVNVNTATAEVLRASFAGLSAEDSRQLVAQRQQAPFISLEAFAANKVFHGKVIDLRGLTINSEYYELATTLQHSDGDGGMVLRGLVHWRHDGSAAILARHVGYF